jgi:hypothetical protein
MGEPMLEVRETLDSDIEGVVALFCESGGNPYNWSTAKWKHYYREYPEGKPVSFIATFNGRVVGHYGMLPVIIGSHTAMLGLHAYVAENQRGLTVISTLMKEVDLKCRNLGIALIGGFANSKFSMIKRTFFKWKTPCWLGFQQGVDNNDLDEARNRKFSFKYSQDWYKWRFGGLQNEYLSRYIDSQGIIKKQLLKTTPTSHVENIVDAEAWSPQSTHAENKDGQFFQPFSIKIFDERLIDEGILDHNNWSIEMGDSDTFQYIPWEQKND